jgi:hypothetical protein
MTARLRHLRGSGNDAGRNVPGNVARSAWSPRARAAARRTTAAAIGISRVAAAHASEPVGDVTMTGEHGGLHP